MSNLDINQLQNLPNRLVQKIPYLKMLILFGSRARGDTHPNSDWDFAALYDDKLRNHNLKGFKWFEIYGVLADYFEISDEKIDLVDLNRCSPLIAHYVARDGQLLYEQEPGLFEEFKQKALMNDEQLDYIQKSLRQKLENFLEVRGV
ncbi:DNA polymerase beta domain protein region (plasmid) [Rippkaea orientalis PCC 8801]|uniref:DNA polymerase beta domain protein region n=1 Tax=Rippkaea orientalis (strain PCC 8801 / RF-1) TaxID=41431 RepID=B7K6H8_RIPO1|nr:nucleotidyltransferase domain-containing protein [Rippkaea orientalis]ACK68400.1 DNA polymerase beta domain protein region [Rippkaea orientalis PCC 8801]